MLIPLGFWAASGSGGGTSAGAFELISTATGTGSSGVITFSSIPQTYKHLQLRVVSKSTDGSTGQYVHIKFNSDTSGYTYHTLTNNGSGVSSSADITSSHIRLLLSQASSTTAGECGTSITDILDYTAITKNKTLRALSGRLPVSLASNITLTSGFLASTTAITSLTLTASIGSFATLTRASLYGIKG